MENPERIKEVLTVDLKGRKQGESRYFFKDGYLMAIRNYKNDGLHGFCLDLRNSCIINMMGMMGKVLYLDFFKNGLMFGECFENSYVGNITLMSKITDDGKWTIQLSIHDK